MGEDDNITINVSDLDLDNTQYTIDMSSINNYAYTTTGSFNYGNITIGASGNSYSTVGYTSPWSSPTAQSSLQVSGDAEFEGDVKIKGVSIGEAIEKINKRLAILVPDPAKLEHFEALKKAYDNYKTLEALCELPKPDPTDA